MPSACVARAATSFCNVIFVASFLQRPKSAGFQNYELLRDDQV